MIQVGPFGEMELPRRIVIQPRALERVPAVLDDLGVGGRVMVISDAVTRAIAGSAVASSVRASGREVSEWSVPGPDLEASEALSAELVGFDAVVCVGGGTVIDVGKDAACRSRLPFVSVPTAASHDGIASAHASLRVAGVKRSLQAKPPAAVVADLDLIARSPPSMQQAGCGDVLSNLSAVRDWQLASKLRGEPYSIYAASLSEMSARIVWENAEHLRPSTVEGADLVTKALVSSGIAMSIAGSSRPASGGEHLISHYLDRVLPEPRPHGFQVAMAAVLTLYLHGGDWGGLRRVMAALGLPVTCDEIDIPPDLWVEALVRAHTVRPERYTILSGGVTEGAARRAMRRSLLLS